MNHLDVAALTDVGRKRAHNEDSLLVDGELSLFVVCDGMGGHAAGDVASALAARTLHEEVTRGQTLIEAYRAKPRGADLVTERDVLAMLEAAVNRASSRVHAEAARDATKRGMGTTLVAALFVGNHVFIVHVGDSRMYRLRDGALTQVTEDHSVYQELLKRTATSREQAAQRVPKNALTRAVGVFAHCAPDSQVLEVADGDRFLLCSDGLSHYFEDDTPGLASLLAGEDAGAAVQSLIEVANERGGGDNITAILVTAGAAGVSEAERAATPALTRERLARLPLFQPLDAREIDRVLEVARLKRYADGDVVARAGEDGEELCIVLEGAVDVMRGRITLATLMPGEHVGELSLTRNQPRAATVKANGRSLLMVIRRRDFLGILRNERQLAVKLLWQFLCVVSDRLAYTSGQLVDAREVLADNDLTERMSGAGGDEGRAPANRFRSAPRVPNTGLMSAPA
jgi:serine/threonine protein phosphatase PrpC/CRP-like cAMP-binding protein